MTQPDKKEENDFFMPEEKSPAPEAAWKILVVDDQDEVHRVTRLALKGMKFLGRPVQFLDAFTAAGAEKVLTENPDVALALIDVVMEKESSGLELVRTIREKMGNHLIRIVLRTGLPDVAPEKEIIEKYDINDYRSKTELTATRLFSIVLSSLRTFALLFELEWKRLEYQHLNEHLEKAVEERTAELRNKEEMMRSIMDASLTPLVIIRICGGQVMFVNRKGAELYGASVEEVIGRRDYLQFEDPLEQHRLYGRIMRDGHVEDAEVRLSVRGGAPFWALFSAVRMTYDGELCLLFYFVDITKRKEMENELRRLAMTDLLTGVCNRGCFMDFAERERARAIRIKIPFGLLMFDLDRFKTVNDTYGHAIGDEVLKAFAASCRAGLRPMDVFARLGGEEFVALLPETNEEEALAVAERLRAKTAALRLKAGTKELSFTVSTGVTVFHPDMPDTVSALLKQADLALYRAKKDGRNCVRLFRGGERRTKTDSPFAPAEKTEGPPPV